MENNSWLVLVYTAFLFAFIHNSLPSHWFPYVLTSHAQKWNMGTTLFMAGIGGLTHIFFTAVVGLFIGILGEWLKEKAEVWLGIFVGIVVFMVGLLFIMRGFDNLKHGHSHADHCHHTKPKKEAFLLGFAYGMRPCAEAIGMAIAAGTYGFFASIITIAAWATASVLTMATMTWLGMKGLKSIRLNWMEKYAELFSGFIITLVGLWTIKSAFLGL